MTFIALISSTPLARVTTEAEANALLGWVVLATALFLKKQWG